MKQATFQEETQSNASKLLKSHIELEEMLFAPKETFKLNISKLAARKFDKSETSYVYSVILYASRVRPYSFPALSKIIQGVGKPEHALQNCHFTEFLKEQKIIEQNDLLPLDFKNVKTDEETELAKTLFENDFEKLKNLKIKNKMTILVNEKAALLDALSVAAFFGAFECFEFLNENKKFKITNDVLSFVVRGGNTKIADFCLKKGHKFDGLMKIAVEFHRNEMIDWLLKNGSKKEEIDVNMLIKSFNTKAVLEYGLDDLEKRDEEGFTAFSMACYVDNLELAKFFYSKGAKIDSKDRYGYTPLLQASIIGQTTIANYLIDSGANIEIEDKTKRTPLICASSNNNLDIVKKLVEKGANIEARDEFEYTPIIFAATYGFENIVKYLHEKGANIEAASSFGYTPLISAAYGGHIDVVKYLIDNKANIESCDENEWTALLHAAFSGKTEVAKLLVESKANIKHVDSRKWNALMHASFNQHLDTIRYLIECGIDPKDTDAEGHNAYDIGLDYSKEVIEEYIGPQKHSKCLLI